MLLPINIVLLLHTVPPQNQDLFLYLGETACIAVYYVIWYNIYKNKNTKEKAAYNHQLNGNYNERRCFPFDGSPL